MPKRPDADEAFIDLLARHKAEWADFEQELLRRLQPTLRKRTAEALAKLRKGKPSRKQIEEETRRIAELIPRAIKAATPERRKIAARHARELKAALAKRSGKRIKLPLFTPSEIRRRVEAERETEDVKPEPPKETE